MIARLAGLMIVFGLTSASAGMAQADAGDAPCGVGLRFVLGPVVNGHNRQPTPAEFEARKRAREEWSRMVAGSCGAARISAKASLPVSSEGSSPEAR